MVRLTADLIWKSPHFFNAIKERELDIRGNKIAVIENLGATEDQFDTIDLSDNEIVKLENLPYLNRLGTLLINNNRITRINPNIGEFLPKLHTLVLTNNRLVNLVEIDPLSSLPKLQFLSLLDNNITKKPNYRLYVIHKLKALRVLDFKKVKSKERLEAAKLFASKEVEEQVRKAPEKPSIPKVTEVSQEQTPKIVAPTPEQILAIKKLSISFLFKWGTVLGVVMGTHFTSGLIDVEEPSYYLRSVLTLMLQPESRIAKVQNLKQSNHYMQAGLLFRNSPDEVDFMTTFMAKLKNSLDDTLSDYYPLSGRIATIQEENPHTYIVCIGLDYDIIEKTGMTEIVMGLKDGIFNRVSMNHADGDGAFLWKFRKKQSWNFECNRKFINLPFKHQMIISVDSNICHYKKGSSISHPTP
ncbi:hypothetical protein ACFE04_024580 [Oxalis oulophora]